MTKDIYRIFDDLKEPGPSPEQKRVTAQRRSGGCCIGCGGAGVGFTALDTDQAIQMGGQAGDLICRWCIKSTLADDYRIDNGHA